MKPPRACVAFYSNQLCERGTEISLYDYADYAERLLGVGRPLILYERDNPNNFLPAVRKFEHRFGKERVIGIRWPNPQVRVLARLMALLTLRRRPPPTLDEVLLEAGVRDLYMQKAGDADDRLSRLRRVRTHVHAVFWARQPHGHSYARISPTVPGPTGLTPNPLVPPVVPYMVRPGAPHGANMRESLGIPPNATVFCRHGGATTFDIDYVRTAICAYARTHQHTFFVFMNTPPFCRTASPHGNVVHLPPTSSEARKSRFIRTCDAMVHARTHGERRHGSITVPAPPPTAFSAHSAH
jgi:hypothetical protein